MATTTTTTTTHHLIDAQFDRAVEIVQSLPQTGPIQTDYEEKLQMYSLYKQATVGNVQSARPVFLDVLGRAKWDAWAKHKDMEQYEAKWLYVETLLKVLRRYSDKTTARNLVQELESYAGDPSNLVLSRISMRSTESESSGSTRSQVTTFPQPPPPPPPPQQQQHQSIPSSQAPHHFSPVTQTLSDESLSETETENEQVHLQYQPSRQPHSSHSTYHYQTPITGSVLSQTSSMGGVPDTQPLPSFKTPSAFPAPSSASTPATSGYARPPSTSIPNPRPYSPRFNTNTISRRQDTVTDTESHRLQHQHHHHPLLHGPSPDPVFQQTTLETTIENVQAHLAALTERLDILESSSSSLPKSTSSFFIKRSPPKTTAHSDFLFLGSTSAAAAAAGGGGGGGSTTAHGRSSSSSSPSHAYPYREWNSSSNHDLGLWSHVLNPLARLVSVLRRVGWMFLASDDVANRSPVMVVARRLCLDISFLVCLLVLLRALWRKSRVWRREVRVALVVLWKAIVGTRTLMRSLQERDV